VDPSVLLTSLDVWHDNMFSSSIVAMLCIADLKIQVLDLCWLDSSGSGGLCHMVDSRYWWGCIRLFITCGKVIFLCIYLVCMNRVVLCYIVLSCCWT
jgi:hypothetical protein